MNEPQRVIEEAAELSHQRSDCLLDLLSAAIRVRLIELRLTPEEPPPEKPEGEGGPK